MCFCALCSKYIKSFSCKLSCTVCNKHFHSHCVPNIMKTDVEYLAPNWICICCNMSNFPFNHFEKDSNFIKAVSENNVTYKVIMSQSILNEMIFNPFELNDEFNFSHVNDIDPDLEFYNNISPADNKINVIIF